MKTLRSRKMASVTGLVTSLSCLIAPLAASAATSQIPSNMFNIPSKTKEELKSIIDELPTIRSNLRGTDADAASTASSSGTDTNTDRQPYRRRASRSPEEKAEERINRAERYADRRVRAKEFLRNHKPDPEVLQKVPQEDLDSSFRSAFHKGDDMLEDENHRWLRDLKTTTTVGTNVPSYMASTDEYYDPWQQGYRMLGGYIDCDNEADGGGSGDGDGACSRWMMWAAYVNPYYGGGGRDEYFTYDEDGAAAVVNLDCHSPDTEWELMGVYRQEFYQFIEQISKHLWAIDDYEYVVALAGLAYMTDDDCNGVGYDYDGNYLYAGVMPYAGGMYMMGLYKDNQCIEPDDSGMNYDDFGLTNDMDLGSKDDGCLDDDTLATLYEFWSATQEYTLELLNEVYSEYKYCTLCMDYPTYQDGYFIGDTGTDEDDMINQCWKFHSHDSFVCTSDCLAVANEQGSILQIKIDDTFYGTSWDGSGSGGNSKVYDHYSKGYTSDGGSNLERFKANAYLTFNGVLFIATFLAFSVARGSRADSSEKSRSLLSRADRKKSRSSTRSRSKKSSGSRSSRKKSSGSTTRRSSSRKKSGYHK